MARKFLAYVVFVVLFALLFNLAAAQSDELFDYHSLSLELLITNRFSVVPTSTDSFLDYTSAELSWYPREDYRQKVDFITTEPEASFNENQGFFFEWKQPSQTNFLLEEKSAISTKNEFVRVTKKIDFPLKDLDPAYSEYLAPQEIIDINDKVRQAASEVVQGEKDLYPAVFKIAEWVENNINYNLSTMTAEATQKASWVIDNKQGVCDELTSLFISMCRSLGIPARFVTGISYSNINLQNDGWGPHGWAEVYFPSAGWVPFDVTYKELGFVDATHIKLKTSLDAKETSIGYATKSKNTDIKPGPLEFNVKVTGKDYKTKPAVSLEAEVAEPLIGFGSYNLLILTVKNRNTYYVTTRLGLANVNDLEILNDNFRPVLMKPGEEKKIYWMMRISPDLAKNFIYTFPLKIIASFGETASTSFKVAESVDIYSEEYMRMFMTTEQPEEKPYSKNILLSCSVEKDKLYLNAATNISCTLDNQGDQTLRNTQICLDNECSTSRVPIGGTARYDYVKSFETLGIKTLVFRVINELVDKSYYMIIDVQDKPLVEITNLSFPEKLNYKDTSEIKFFVKKKSITAPRNVKVRVEHKLMHQEWDIPSLEQDYEFRVMISGENLNLEKNDFRIIITYQDEQSKEYRQDESFAITLNNPTLLQKVIIWSKILEYQVTQWFNNF